jgi:hypothetical protein
MSVDVLFEIRFYEPAIGKNPDAPVDGRSEHPARYRYTNCWMKEKEGILHCCLVGGEGWFAFPDGKCNRFLGEFQAEIIGEISPGRLVTTPTAN